MTAISFDISTKALAQLVKPVVPLAAKDGMLPLLNCVQFQAIGKYLTASATDRYRVGICRVELETPPPVGLDIKIGLAELRQLLAVFKSDAKVERTVTITVLEDRIKVEQAFGFGFIDASMGFPLVKGKYPTLTTLFKPEDRSEPVATIGVTAAYLADFRHATRTGEPLVIRSGNEGKAVVVTAGDHFIGALMPTRSSASNESLDSWADVLTTPPTEPAAKPSGKKSAA